MNSRPQQSGVAGWPRPLRGRPGGQLYGSEIVGHAERERLRARAGETHPAVSYEADSPGWRGTAVEGAARRWAAAVLAIPRHAVSARPDRIVCAETVAHVGIAEDEG